MRRGNTMIADGGDFRIRKEDDDVKKTEKPAVLKITNTMPRLHILLRSTHGMRPEAGSKAEKLWREKFNAETERMPLAPGLNLVDPSWREHVSDVALAAKELVISASTAPWSDMDEAAVAAEVESCM